MVVGRIALAAVIVPHIGAYTDQCHKTHKGQFVGRYKVFGGDKFRNSNGGTYRFAVDLSSRLYSDDTNE